MPKSAVPVNHDFLVSDERIHWPFLKDQLVTVVKILKHLPATDKVSARYQAPGHLGFLIELEHLAVVITCQFAKSSRRTNSGNRQNPAMVFVKRDKLIEIYVTDGVAICQQEVGFSTEVFLDALDSSAGHRSEPRIGQCDTPMSLGMITMILDTVCLTECDRAIPGMRLVI